MCNVALLRSDMSIAVWLTTYSSRMPPLVQHSFEQDVVTTPNKAPRISNPTL